MRIWGQVDGSRMVIGQTGYFDEQQFLTLCVFENALKKTRKMFSDLSFCLRKRKRPLEFYSYGEKN